MDQNDSFSWFKDKNFKTCFTVLNEKKPQHSFLLTRRCGWLLNWLIFCVLITAFGGTYVRLGLPLLLVRLRLRQENIKAVGINQNIFNLAYFTLKSHGWVITCIKLSNFGLHRSWVIALLCLVIALGTTNVEKTGSGFDLRDEAWRK